MLCAPFNILSVQLQLVQGGCYKLKLLLLLTNPAVDLRLLPCSGHALLVGVGGSGKQSLARLSGFICGYATYTIVISGNYNMNNFREDLQKMYKRAGVKVSCHCCACPEAIAT